MFGIFFLFVSFVFPLLLMPGIFIMGPPNIKSNFPLNMHIITFLNVYFSLSLSLSLSLSFSHKHGIKFEWLENCKRPTETKRRKKRKKIFWYECTQQKRRLNTIKKNALMLNIVYTFTLQAAYHYSYPRDVNHKSDRRWFASDAENYTHKIYTRCCCCNRCNNNNNRTTAQTKKPRKNYKI